MRLECDQPGSTRVYRAAAARGAARRRVDAKPPAAGQAIERRRPFRMPAGGARGRRPSRQPRRAAPVDGAATLVLYAGTSYQGKDSGGGLRAEARGPGGQAIRRRAAGAHCRAPPAVPPRGNWTGRARPIRRSHRRASGRDEERRHDPQLLAMYFQYGRYLLLSSSRPGTLPANLQGIWADGLHRRGKPTITSTSTSR